VLGESGCGKTTLILAAMGLLPSFASVAGEARIDGVEVLVRGEESARAVRWTGAAMVFQGAMSAMNPVYRVGKQIADPMVLRGRLGKAEARRHTSELLELVGLPPSVARRYPHELSGGMRQRAVIAMALSCHPSLLIADEPTTALDVTTEAQILELMRSLQQEFGMGIMYITHNLGVIAEMAEKVAVMYMGKVVEETDVKSIFFDPLHPYSRGLLASIPQLDEAVSRGTERRRLQTIKGMVPDPYSRLKGCPFHPRCPEFIADVCDQVEPDAVFAKPGHLVRCHLYSPTQPSRSAETLT
jgi:oligopeptide/dipeptide ABC transporter ATP-binding protein